MRLTFEYNKTAGAGLSPQAVHMMDNGLRFIYLTSDGLVEANECFILSRRALPTRFDMC